MAGTNVGLLELDATGTVVVVTMNAGHTPGQILPQPTAQAVLRAGIRARSCQQNSFENLLNLTSPNNSWH